MSNFTQICPEISGWYAYKETLKISYWNIFNRLPGSVDRLRYIQEVQPYSGSILIVWAAIIKNLGPELISVDENVSAESYVKGILRAYTNALSYTAPRTREYLTMGNIRALPRPARSPHLNPIEQAWDMLQRRVLEKLDGLSTTQQLKDLLKFPWDRFSKEYTIL